jgi:alcohol dehydrogenase class IV
MQVFVCPPRIITGDGCAASLGAEAAALGASRVVIVTDKVVHQQTDSITNALASLSAAGIQAPVFDDVEPDPLITTVRRCAEFVRSAGADVLVGIGGGSSMDTAKGAATVLSNEAPLDVMWGRGNVPKPALPMILLPTTGGTGSEVSTSCVLTDIDPGTGEHVKKSIVSAMVLPRTAMIDPLLTMSAPPRLTAATGMDALTHAIESYVSKGAMPLTDTLALEATALIGRYLRRAVGNGSDLEARRNMANAAMMAGLAFSNAQLGIVHAFAMVMGSRFGVPHGVANALMLPYGMEFNEMAHTPRFAEIARALGEPIQGLSECEAAHRAAVAVYRLNADVGMPLSLGDVNIPREAIPALAEATFANQRLRGVNPRGTTLKDITGMLEQAAAGCLARS